MVEAAPTRIVVIGGSAGGLDSLIGLIDALPADFPAAVCVAIHTAPHGRSMLPTILGRRARVDVAVARHGEPLRAGTVRTAPADRHLMVRDGHLAVVTAPRENGHRPAIDPLFRSAARTFRGGCISIVLSGALDDGSAGTVAVRFRGGTTIAQDPADALFPDMPANAIKTECVDYIVPASEIAELLDGLVRAPAVHLVPDDVARQASVGDPVDPVDSGIGGDGAGFGGDERTRREAAALDLQLAENMPHPAPPGYPSEFSCPACGGVLFEQAGPVVQYLCRVGHRYSPQTLEAGQLETLEEALWTALRALEERAALSERVADRAAQRGDSVSEDRFRERQADDLEHADSIRSVLRAVLPALEPDVSDGEHSVDDAGTIDRPA
ncbi:MAG: chemotaxis protein CheB [Chloroflexota bacterium]